MDALIGYTGFIGWNLKQQRSWGLYYRRANSADMRGEHFNTVVCCAAPGIKRLANRCAMHDLVEIQGLMYNLAQIEAKRFILISTADVFAQPVDADEDSYPNPTSAYGDNRFWLEREVRRQFQNHLIVRLPGVIGPGLKKNAYFDLENQHRVEYLNGDSVYQWYDVRNLWKDIEHVTVPILHMAPPPISIFELCRKSFPHLLPLIGQRGEPAQYYNLRTKYT